MGEEVIAQNVSENRTVDDLSENKASMFDVPPSQLSYSTAGVGKNTDFMVEVSGVVRVKFAATPYASGQPIQWELFEDSVHSSLFATSVTPMATGLQINIPNAKTIYNGVMTPDETYGTQMLICGPTITGTYMNFHIFRNRLLAANLTGAGTSVWVGSGSSSYISTIGTFDANTGITLLTFSSTSGYAYAGGFSIGAITAAVAK